MVVAVSFISGICWATDSTLHIIKEVHGSYKLSPASFPTAHTLLMFNAAFNPFAYALINQRFRQKIKGMICGRSSSSSLPRVKDSPQNIEMIPTCNHGAKIS